MEARNLMPEDCNKLEDTMKEIKKTNPDAIHSFFQKEENVEHIDLRDKVYSLEEKIDALNSKLDKIFGNAVLINGEWKHL